MIGVGVITHGELASGLKNAIHMIMGETEKFEIVSLEEGADLDEFSASVLSLVESINEKDGVLIFVDMFGATPFNTVAQVREQFKDKGIAVQMITGVNLPMVMEALSMRTAMSLDELAPAIVNSGKETIQALEISSVEA